MIMIVDGTTVLTSSFVIRDDKVAEKSPARRRRLQILPNRVVFASADCATVAPGLFAWCCTGIANSGIMPPMKYWETVADKLSAAGWSWVPFLGS
jgi:hypothetical protein